MAKVRANLDAQITRIADAASERVRAHALESGDRSVLQLLDRICEGKCVFSERARYIDTMTAEAQRLGDSQRVAELRTMHEELVRDLQQFKFLAETAFEFLAPKVSA
jgi:hypothetical protein